MPYLHRRVVFNLSFLIASVLSLVPQISHAQSRSSVYLLYPFRCEVINGEPRFTKTGEPYYHEALDSRPPQTYSICGDKGEWRASESFLTTCQEVSLTSLRLVCKGGIITAPELAKASDGKRSKDARIDGDQFLWPIYNRFRETDNPSGFHRLPANWAPIPQPRATLTARDLPVLYGARTIPISGHAETALPDSFFLTLANLFPLPHLLLFPILLGTAALAFFGFSLYPKSQFSPRRYAYWVWLLIAVLGLHVALLSGNAITNALEQGQAEARAIAADQAKLASLFPTHDGHVEPFTKAGLDFAAGLMQPRTITSAAATGAGTPMRFFLYLLPALLFLITYARFAFAGYHHLFVRHPAEAVAAPALQTGELFDKHKMADVLSGDPNELTQHPPVHRILNLLRRAKILKEKIEADTEIAEAAMRRDRARAAKAQADREWREARRHLPWWQRFFMR
jgi:hypothetical protein